MSSFGDTVSVPFSRLGAPGDEHFGDFMNQSAPSGGLALVRQG